MSKPGEKITQTNTQTGITVAITSTLILAAFGSRKHAVIVNDGANPVYLFLGAGPAVANQGIRLNANGGSYEINSLNLWVGPIYGIATGGSSNVTVVEE